MKIGLQKNVLHRVEEEGIALTPGPQGGAEEKKTSQPPGMIFTDICEIVFRRGKVKIFTKAKNKTTIKILYLIERKKFPK